MNCTKCKTRAVIDLPRHNAAFCKGCFNVYVHDQVSRAIKSEKMFGKDDRILVAVSGGKDSLALWDILLKMGYKADALYVNLGIGGYSEVSHAKVVQFSETVAAPTWRSPACPHCGAGSRRRHQGTGHADSPSDL